MSPLLPGLCLLLPCPAVAPVAAPENAPEGRYVRIELRGEDRILSLAEVEVIAGGDNLALGGKATQSGATDDAAGSRAVDGDRDGVFNNGSVTHTPTMSDPWWELDLGRERAIDQITLWNRTDCCWDRLEGLTLTVLDEARKAVWSAADVPAPRPRRDFLLGDEGLVDLGPAPAARGRRNAAVEGAIDDGMRAMLELQMADGSWGQSSANYGPGSTGLAVYTLRKQGLPATHQALRRAATFLRHADPKKTYSVACVLLGLCALDDAKDDRQIERLTERLLDWQTSPGPDGQLREMWSYPSGLGDLSNTQFAALALRAAAARGVSIPKGAWTGLLEATLDHLGEEIEVPDVPALSGGGRSRSGPPRAAGFRYRTGGGHAAETGSMTTAGLSILAIVKEGLGGKIPGKFRSDTARAERLARRWMDAHFVAYENPGAGGGWHEYYLYGVERVGALYGLKTFGLQDWYWEGAGDLLRRQKDDGGWGNLSQTCFALLFLSRATATSGEQRSAPQDVWIAEADEDVVRWRAVGNEDHLTVFLTGFGLDGEGLEFEEGPVRGLRVVEVRYFADGREIARLPGAPDQAWEQERFPTRHRFSVPGPVLVHCEVDLLDPEAGPSATEVRTLEGRPLEVLARRGEAGWMEAAASAPGTNLLREAAFELSASSDNADNQAAALAVDGLLETRWIGATSDAAPELTLEFERPLKAERVVLFGLARHDRELRVFDQATRYEIWLDRDRSPQVLEAPADPLEPAVLELERPRKLRRLRIRIAERRPGTSQAGRVGLAEIVVLPSR